MCIIVLKPKNKDIPEKETLRTCFYNNPDGAGYMFAKSNKVIIKKGYMTFKAFYKSIMKDYKKYNLKDNNLVMHFRIGTQAMNDAKTTHPYPVSDKVEDLQNTRITCSLAMVHNGILYNHTDPKNKILNDSQLFIKDFIFPLMCLNKQFLKYDISHKLIKSQLTSDKLAFLDNKGKYTLFGEFIKDNGIYYSNNTYKSYYWTYKYDYNYSIDSCYNDYSVSYNSVYNDKVCMKNLDELRYISDDVLVDACVDLKRNDYYYAIDKNYTLYEIKNTNIDDKNNVECIELEFDITLYDKETLNQVFFDNLAIM